MMTRFACPAFVAFTVISIACTKPEAKRPPPPARTCTDKPPPGTVHADGAGLCKSDADCKDGIEGRCNFMSNGRMAPTNQCTFDLCSADKDCNAGTLCICNGGLTGRNECVLANCHDATDCGGSQCGLSPAGAGSDTYSYAPAGRYCKTTDDKCTDDKPCKQGDVCAFSTSHSRWECMKITYPPPG